MDNISSTIYYFIFTFFSYSTYIINDTSSVTFFSDNLSTERINKNLSKIFIITYLFTGIVYAKSDYWYASIYKFYSPELSKTIKYIEKNNFNKTIWFKGSWGWQWYAKKNGFKHYVSNVSNPNTGDILILPENVWGTQAPNELNLNLIYEYKVERDQWFKKFSMIWFYSYYSFFNDNKKFYSNNLAENFRVYKIVGLKKLIE